MRAGFQPSTVLERKKHILTLKYLEIWLVTLVSLRFPWVRGTPICKLFGSIANLGPTHTKIALLLPTWPMDLPSFHETFLFWEVYIVIIWCLHHFGTQYSNYMENFSLFSQVFFHIPKELRPFFEMAYENPLVSLHFWSYFYKSLPRKSSRRSKPNVVYPGIVDEMNPYGKTTSESLRVKNHSIQ